MKIKTNYIKFLMNGMTVKELAEKTNISYTWLSTVLSKGDASMSLVNKIANVLDVDPSEIVILDD
ncbi:helix-turn-helix domain-containing protein [Anaerococcus degeneri]|uniref:Helix-turn-helix transcriptional regulator n=1 Tax=Anaerococcus degeneri TaxID=361500 RepID=A0ABS7YWY5_9FIRM|nr:helix-turn-helix transcriptional regulator [Anaerococcus degeneri]MBP2015351.1 transcriptional regulator with XRE-family HTH domain [Anaerococcus degeneri]MCA2096247.1 helix-turn-helix transcriptional regulator [Anaerococcus degeneri]